MSLDDVRIATEKAMTVQEKGTLPYVSGYFFRRLMGFHQSNCDICSQHGSKITASFVPSDDSELFLFLKRYSNEKATLYKCTDHMESFIWKIIQISVFCFQNHMDSSGIVGKINHACHLYMENIPNFCSNMKDRFVKLVAKVMIVFHMKWKNQELKALKRGSGNKGSKSEKKLKKLTNH